MLVLQPLCLRRGRLQRGSEWPFEHLCAKIRHFTGIFRTLPLFFAFFVPSCRFLPYLKSRIRFLFPFADNTACSNFFFFYFEN